MVTIVVSAENVNNLRRYLIILSLNSDECGIHDYIVFAVIIFLITMKFIENNSIYFKIGILIHE